MPRARRFMGLLYSPLLPSPVDPTAFSLLCCVLPQAELFTSCLPANWIHLCRSWSLFSKSLFSGHRRIVETVDHGKKRDRFVFDGEGAMKSPSSGTPFLYLSSLECTVGMVFYSHQNRRIYFQHSGQEKHGLPHSLFGRRHIPGLGDMLGCLGYLYLYFTN